MTPVRWNSSISRQAGDIGGRKGIVINECGRADEGNESGRGAAHGRSGASEGARRATSPSRLPRRRWTDPGRVRWPEARHGSIGQKRCAMLRPSLRRGGSVAGLI
jgi:hypothetical protein